MMCVTAQAFFFPTRLAVAFVISILTVVTFCVLTINVIKSVRNSVSRADAAAIRGIFTGLSSVQKLFYSTTSQEVGGPLNTLAHTSGALHEVAHTCNRQWLATVAHASTFLVGHVLLSAKRNPQPFLPSASFLPSCLPPLPRADHPLFPSQLFDDEISWAYGQVSLGA